MSSRQEITVESSIMQVVKVENPNNKRIAEIPGYWKQDILLVRHHNTVNMAVKFQQMWERFWARQILCPSKNNSFGAQVISVVHQSSSTKCLNDSSRALLLKLTGLTLLATVGVVSAWLCQVRWTCLDNNIVKATAI